MKIELTGKEFVIGKRVTVGAAINSVASIFAFIFPDHAPAIVASAVPFTFLVQVYIANQFGVTQ
jgi:hypothetical protein